MSAKPFAEILKKARETAGLSQKALAARIQMTGSYISQLESGARRPPRLKVIQRLSKALGIAERRLREPAELERSPPPIRKRIERMNKERGQIRRTRDRLLITTLFHMGRHPMAVDPMGAFLGVPPDLRPVALRLVSRARKVKSLDEAEKQSEDLLAETTAQELDALARVLPGVLAAAAPTPTEGSVEGPAARHVSVYLDSLRSGAAVDAIQIDERLGSKQAFLLRIRDDEAHPRVEAGDLLLLDPARKPHGGDTVVVHRDGADLVRTWHEQGGGVKLDATRPDLPPLRMASEDFDGLVVLLLLRALR